MYKAMTGTMTEVLLGHVTQKNLIPEEQRALKRRTRSCLDALVIDTAVTREARKGLSVAWIDYRKAFDMIPHKRLERVVYVSGMFQSPLTHQLCTYPKRKRPGEPHGGRCPIGLLLDRMESRGIG